MLTSHMQATSTAGPFQERWLLLDEPDQYAVPPSSSTLLDSFIISGVPALGVPGGGIAGV